MKQNLNKVTACIFTLLLVSFGARAQLKSYSYYNSIFPVDTTAYYKLPVPNSVLFHAGKPPVMRVYELSGKDTLEVPYLRGTDSYGKYDQYVYPIKTINQSFISHKTSYYTFVCDTDLVYSSLNLTFRESEYDKDVVLEGSDDNKIWKTIAEYDKLFSFNRSASDRYTRSRIYFPPQNYRYLRVSIDDSHSARVNLQEASLLCTYEVPDDPTEEIIPMTMKRYEDKQAKKTVLMCRFSRRYNVTALKFDIKHDAPFFRRDIHVYQSGLNIQKKKEWYIYRDEYLVSNAYNYIPLADPYLNELNVEELKIEIDNLDDQPLKDIGLIVYTNTEMLRLKLEKGKEYVLAYGKDKDHEPQYDIEHFRHTLPRKISTAKLGDMHVIEHQVTPVEKNEPFFKSNAWIWGLMIASIILIGGFAVSLLKQPGKGK
ncbi:MAG: hypothetical protein JST26_18095 [Bacteroidetes bacterium]|nr:hypothetical protein [Bacteroidota bacterium]